MPADLLTLTRERAKANLFWRYLGVQVDDAGEGWVRLRSPRPRRAPAAPPAPARRRAGGRGRAGARLPPAAPRAARPHRRPQRRVEMLLLQVGYRCVALPGPGTR